MTKSVETTCKYDKSIQMLDLKLDVFGVFEDDWYSNLPILVKNVRRGNTIIKKIHDDKSFSFSIGRKGLMKFFDMRLQYVNKKERNVQLRTEDGF